VKMLERKTMQKQVRYTKGTSETHAYILLLLEDNKNEKRERHLKYNVKFRIKTSD